MQGLAPHTASIFEPLSKLDILKCYTLVGGTALSLQLTTRLSEDLDFMSWRTSKNEKREVDWPKIKKELESIGTVEKIDILDIDHVEFVVNGVKISFYANPNYSPLQKRILFLNNIHIADPLSIGAMKMEVMMRRSKFRDYYDIYSLLMANINLLDMINLALKYSGHKMKTKNILAMLTRSERFIPDASFSALMPTFDVTPQLIEAKIKETLGGAN